MIPTRNDKHNNFTNKIVQTNKSVINLDNFYVIKGAVDLKYFPYKDDMKDFICLLVIDGKVQCQSSVDIHGDFKFSVTKKDASGKSTKGNVQILLIKIPSEGNERDNEMYSIVNWKSVTQLNECKISVDINPLEEELTAVSEKVKEQLNCIEQSNVQIGWNRKTYFPESIRSYLENIRLSLNTLDSKINNIEKFINIKHIDKEIVTQISNAKSEPFFYTFHSVPLTNYNAFELKFTHGAISVNDFKDKTGISLRD